MVNGEKEESGVNEYSDAIDSLFDNNHADGVVIRFESDGYVLCVEIRNGKTEIIVYKL